MDIEFANKNMETLGVIKDCFLDTEISKECENCTFEIKTKIDKYIFDNARYIFVHGTENGGIVDKRKIITESKAIVFNGRSWRKIIGSKIICPEPGTDYFIISGDMTYIISSLLTIYGLDNLFYVSEKTTKEVTMQFDRYIDLYSGIMKMVISNGYKINICYNKKVRKAEIKVIQIVEYNNIQDINSDKFDFELSETYNRVNHMIGLGSGELKDRMIIHKYIQKDGSIGDSQCFFGCDEIVSVNDYPNAESYEELEKSTIEKLQEIYVDDETNVIANDITADIGDIFYCNEFETGIILKEKVITKIITIENNTENIQYKVGA